MSVFLFEWKGSLLALLAFDSLTHLEVPAHQAVELAPGRGPLTLSHVLLLEVPSGGNGTPVPAVHLADLSRVSFGGRKQLAVGREGREQRALVRVGGGELGVGAGRAAVASAAECAPAVSVKASSSASAAAAASEAPTVAPMVSSALH